MPRCCISVLTSPPVHSFIAQAQQKGWRLMVRSTGKEDSEEFSNAGGNESFANVSPDFPSVKASMNGVIASYVAPKSMMQRSEAQEDVFSKPYTPVLLQRMIGEDLNGALDSARVPVGCVVYTQEPFGNTPGVSLIQASFGHNEGVVNSTVATDSFYVDAHGTVRAVIKKKPQRIIPTFDGTKYKLEFKSNPVELQNAPALTDADVRIVKRVSDAIQLWYGKPMDVELIFERHTKTVYLVQARPLQVVKQMRPQYLESVQESALIRGTTVNPDNCSVRHITNAQQLIIAPTLNDALEVFNAPGFQTKPVQAVIVQADAEATSHAAAIFRGAGKPIFRINDLDILRDWLKEATLSFFLDVQREILVRDPEAMIVAGWFTHPMPLALSVEQQDGMAEPLPVALADYFPGESNAMLVDKLKSEADTNVAMNALASLVYRAHVAMEQLRASDTEATHALMKDTETKGHVLTRYLAGAAQALVTYGLTLEPRNITRMYYVKTIESLFFQQEAPLLVDAFSVNNLEKRYVAYVGFVETHGKELTSSILGKVPLLEIARIGGNVALSKTLEDRWVSFVSAVARMKPERNQELFMQMFKALSDLGALPVWVNISFNQKWLASGEKPFETLQALHKEYLQAGDFVERLNAIQSHLDAINVSDWEKPDKFNALLKDFEQNVLAFFMTDEFVDLLSKKHGKSFKKIIVLPVMSKLIDTFDDKFIKTFKGSTQYAGNEHQHVANFRKVVTTYFSILEKWSPLIKSANPECAAQGYCIQSIPKYIASLKERLMGITSDDPDQLLPSADFNVSAQTYPNYVKNTKFKLLANHLEDFFTLSHQNINFLINRLMSEVGIDAVEKPAFFTAVENEILKVTPSTKDFARINKISLIGVKLTDSSLSFMYNLPLRVHGETFEIIYDKNAQVVYVTVTIVTDDPRSKHLDKDFFITMVSRIAGLPLKDAPHIVDNEMSFTFKIKPDTSIQHLYDAIMFINATTYSEFKKKQLSDIPEVISGLARAYVRDNADEVLAALRKDFASGDRELNVVHYLLIKDLLEQGKVTRKEDRAMFKRAIENMLPTIDGEFKALRATWKELLGQI